MSGHFQPYSRFYFNTFLKCKNFVNTFHDIFLLMSSFSLLKKDNFSLNFLSNLIYFSKESDYIFHESSNYLNRYAPIETFGPLTSILGHYPNSFSYFSTFFIFPLNAVRYTSNKNHLVQKHSLFFSSLFLQRRNEFRKKENVFKLDDFYAR